MEKKRRLFTDIFALILMWLLFIFVAGHLTVVGFYFPHLELATTIATVSALLLVIAYTIFWVKRLRASMKR